MLQKLRSLTLTEDDNINDKEDTCNIAVGSIINLQSEYADTHYFKGYYRSDNIECSTRLSFSPMHSCRDDTCAIL